MIAIAVYFCVADGVLISQCVYYNWVNGGKGGAGGRDGDAGTKAVGREEGSGANANGNRAAVGASANIADIIGEEEPLLARQRSGSITIPGSQQRRRRTTSSSASLRRRSSQGSNALLSRIMEEDDKGGKAKVWMKNLVSILGIMAVGTAGWAIAWGSGAWAPTPVQAGDGVGGDTGPVGAQVLGYMSAAAYLGARIPQIVKNARDKSCEGTVHPPQPPTHHTRPFPRNTLLGTSSTKQLTAMTGLSLLFFILSLMGNLTYGAGIIFHSLDRDYIIMNVPWLIGSLGTMVEDVVIFVQFHIYAKAGKGDEEAVV